MPSEPMKPTSEQVGWLLGGEEGVARWNEWRSELVVDSESTLEVPLDLSGISLRGADLRGVNLSYANLSNANLFEAELCGADLYTSDLSGADLTGARLTGARMALANLSEAQMTSAFLCGTELSGASLVGANLVLAQLTGAKLTGADLTRANLDRANLSHANLSESHLMGASLREANLSGAKLAVADLNDANLAGANMTGADLLGVKLTRANLVEARLDRANLGYANLTAAKLLGAHLAGAILDWTVLTEALLWGADLHGTNLSDAHFQDADLRGARNLRLDKCLVQGAQFSPVSSRWWSLLTGSILPWFHRRFENWKCPWLARQVAFRHVPNDPWSVLRQLYSGPRTLFLFFFVIVFALPYVGRLALYGSESQVGTWMTAAWQRQKERMHDAKSRVGRLIEREEREAMEDLERWLKAHPGPRPVWQVLLRWDERKIGPTVLAVVLILYNLGIYWLITGVGPLRDEEERSGWSPAWKDYGYLRWVHRTVTVLFYVSFASLLVNLGELLGKPVWVPTG